MLRQVSVYSILAGAALLCTQARDLWAQEGSRSPFAFENGDTNGDWDLDLSDAVHLLSFLYAGGPAPAPVACGGLEGLQNGDTNGDGTIDLSDGVYLLRYLFQGGRRPADIGCGLVGGAGGGAAVQR